MKTIAIKLDDKIFRALTKAAHKKETTKKDMLTLIIFNWLRDLNDKDINEILFGKDHSAPPLF